MSLCLTPEQTQRLKNDNKRLVGLTERVNSQRAVMEERFKEKKQELLELEKELSVKKVRRKKLIRTQPPQRAIKSTQSLLQAT